MGEARSETEYTVDWLKSGYQRSYQLQHFSLGEPLGEAQGESDVTKHRDGLNTGMVRDTTQLVMVPATPEQ